MQMTETHKCKKTVSAEVMHRFLRHRAADMACGFLMVRGAAAGIYSAGWSMTALTGGSAAAVLGALLFAGGCAAVMLMRRDYGRAASAVCDSFASAGYLLWRLTILNGTSGALIFDCAGVMLALAAVQTKLPRRSAAVMCLSAALILTAAGCFPVSDELLVLRLSALCGEMAAAGLFGAALTELICPIEHYPVWVAAGAALGML